MGSAVKSCYCLSSNRLKGFEVSGCAGQSHVGHQSWHRCLSVKAQKAGKLFGSSASPNLSLQPWESWGHCSASWLVPVARVLIQKGEVKQIPLKKRKYLFVRSEKAEAVCSWSPKYLLTAKLHVR